MTRIASLIYGILLGLCFTGGAAWGDYVTPARLKILDIAPDESSPFLTIYATNVQMLKKDKALDLNYSVEVAWECQSGAPQKTKPKIAPCNGCVPWHADAYHEDGEGRLILVYHVDSGSIVLSGRCTEGVKKACMPRFCGRQAIAFSQRYGTDPPVNFFRLQARAWSTGPSGCPGDNMLDQSSRSALHTATYRTPLR